MKPTAYSAVLKTMYMGKMNPACTCKIAYVENGGITHYSFNQLKLNLEQWLEKCDNEKLCKQLFETFQKCKCE